MKTMTKENKELLLKDLSSRLPYKIKAKVYNHWTDDFQDETITIENLYQLIEKLSIEDIKPYLFPLSSMTEDQALELYKLFGIKLTDSIGWDYIKINEVTGITFFLRKGFDIETHLDKLIDWLLKNNFDFRGLIPMGLALDATGLNIY